MKRTILSTLIPDAPMPRAQLGAVLTHFGEQTLSFAPMADSPNTSLG
jgi:hypothetical protein